MVLDFNDFERVLYCECEIEKILRNNVVIWQAYINILVTLYSNTHYDNINVELYSQTESKDIQVTLNNENIEGKNIKITLISNIDI